MLTAALLALTLQADAGAADAGVAVAAKAVVLFAGDPEAIEKWAKTKPAERAALKGFTDKVKINERMVVAVALDGYELPRSRKVDVTADLVITDSTGRIVLEKASAAFARTFDPRTQTALLLRPFGTLNYGVTDPEGVYTVKVTIWDQVRGEPSKTTASFTVVR